MFSRIHVTTTRSRKFAAWLGIFLIWLTLVMPLVAQWRAHASSMETAICSAGHKAQAAPNDSPWAHHGLDFNACGYCSLLAHSPYIGPSPLAWFGNKSFDAGILPAASPAAPQDNWYVLGYPRGPPVGA